MPSASSGGALSPAGGGRAPGSSSGIASASSSVSQSTTQLAHAFAYTDISGRGAQAQSGSRRTAASSVSGFTVNANSEAARMAAASGSAPVRDVSSAGIAGGALRHGLGSVDMLDASEDNTPRASSPWGSVETSSTGSLMSDATAFQVCAGLVEGARLHAGLVHPTYQGNLSGL